MHGIAMTRLSQRCFDSPRQFGPLRFIAGPERAGDTSIAPDEHLAEIPPRFPTRCLAHPGIERRCLGPAHMADAGHWEPHTEPGLAERLHRGIVGRFLVEVATRHADD